MDKKDCPRLFQLDVIGIGLTIVFGLAGLGFKFWSKFNDTVKLIIIVIIVVIYVVICVVRYYLKVKKFYIAYDELYSKHQALADNYAENKKILEKIQEDNALKEWTVKQAMLLLIQYNDLSEEEKEKIRSGCFKETMKLYGEDNNE